METNPLIDRKARKHKKNKKARVSLDARCERKQKAAVRAAKNYDDGSEDIRYYCR